MPDSKATASRKITQKWRALRKRGLNLGSAQSDVTSAGYGGWYRVFEKGRIYSHHTVGTFEVHGSILNAYLRRNAYGHNSNIGRRELGFPQSDETRTPDRRFPMSQFEWGQIIAVSGARGGVSISGEIYNSWINSPVANRMHGMGYPINSNVKVAGGEAVFFERGLMYFNPARSHTPISIPIEPPLLGNPAIVSPGQETLPIKIPVYDVNLELIGGIDALSKILQGRFYLREVGAKRLIQLTLKASMESAPVVNPGVDFTDIKGDFIKSSTTGISIPALGKPGNHPPFQPGETGEPPKQLDLFFSMPSGSRLSNRTLYDLVFKMDNGYYYKFSPHALYARDSWKDFGLIHATDIHVSRRIDGFRNKLKQAKEKYNRTDLDQGIEHLNNWNDGFRDLIRYANYLHEQGILDGILATGDIVDYQFEDGDNKQAGGNFEFFRKLILGQVKYPNSDKVKEELKVPVFTSLGNHDYRPNAYKLFFSISVVKTVRQFSNFNITETEARAVQDGRPPEIKNSVTIKYGKPEIGISEGEKMIAIGEPTYYFRYVNPQLSYLVRLGKHRLVMLDSGPDTGLPEGIIDAIWAALGNTEDEDKQAVAKSNPNSRGFTLRGCAKIKYPN